MRKNYCAYEQEGGNSRPEKVEATPAQKIQELAERFTTVGNNATNYKDGRTIGVGNNLYCNNIHSW